MSNDSKPATRPLPSHALHLSIPPLFFVTLVLLPLPAVAYPVRASLGLLLWMGWWWVARPVHLAVTALLPLVVGSLFGFVEMAPVLHAYAQELVILLLGANVLTSVWSLWGLDRRIALSALAWVGTGARQQIVAWFLLSALLSGFLPNTIVAAALIPIAVAMLGFVGIRDLWRSRLGTALVVAVAWGTSVGGFLTPLGGAPNLLAVHFLEETTGSELLFLDWLGRMLPLAMVIVAAGALFVGLAFRPERRELGESRAYFREECRRMGPFRGPEKWGLGLFLLALVLVFARPLYARWLPAFTPAYAFLASAVAAFLVRHRGQALITWPQAQEKMMWGLFYLFAGGSALGQILGESGTARFLADALLPLAQRNETAAMIILATLAIVMTQVMSNTAAVAVVVPIAISTCGSLKLDPVPFIYLVTAAGNCGFLLPSSAGGPAVAAGYGINLRAMFLRGLGLMGAALALVVLAGVVL